jgi:hypothetical protein
MILSSLRDTPSCCLHKTHTIVKLVVGTLLWRDLADYFQTMADACNVLGWRSSGTSMSQNTVKHVERGETEATISICKHSAFPPCNTTPCKTVRTEISPEGFLLAVSVCFTSAGTLEVSSCTPSLWNSLKLWLQCMQVALLMLMTKPWGLMGERIADVPTLRLRYRAEGALRVLSGVDFAEIRLPGMKPGQLQEKDISSSIPWLVRYFLQ